MLAPIFIINPIHLYNLIKDNKNQESLILPGFLI